MKLKFYIISAIFFILIYSTSYSMDMMKELIESKFLIAVSNNDFKEFEKIKKSYKLGDKYLNETLLYHAQANTNIERRLQQLDTVGANFLIKTAILNFLAELMGTDQDIYRAAENKFKKNISIDLKTINKFKEYMKDLALKAVKFLIKAGSNKNFKDQNKNTALILAAQDSNKEIVEYLLSLPEIDIESKNLDGKTAQDVAKNAEIKKLIKNKIQELKKPILIEIPKKIDKKTEKKLQKLLAKLNFELNQLKK